MNRSILNKIISKVEKEEEIFADKSVLSTLSLPKKIVGRKKQAEELVRFLVGYKKGFVPPLISVYGRSGSGKTTITRFVCEHFSDISCCYVNLRKAKTIFSVANLILEELGQEQVKSPQGLNASVNKIAEGIVSKLKSEHKNVLVLLLDEVDVIFNDKRGKPSDFFYKLVVLEEKLKQQNYLVSIITVSNQLIGDYDLDERVRSRICNSEIFFEPYTKNDILSILGDRIKKAFSKEPNDSIIECGSKIVTYDLINEHLKFCGKCRSSVLITNNYCTECGCPVENKSTPKIETIMQDQKIEIRRTRNKKNIVKAGIAAFIPLIIAGFLIYHMIGFTVPDLIQNNESVDETNQRLDDAALNLINVCWSQPSDFCDQEMSNLRKDCQTSSQFKNVKACKNSKLSDYIISRRL